MAEIFISTPFIYNLNSLPLPKICDMTIRKNVEYFLKQRGMNKTELSEILGVSNATVTSYLDQPNIGLGTIVRIAKALKLKAADLVVSPAYADWNPAPKKVLDQTIEAPREKKSMNFGYTCPECGTKMKITISEE